MHDCSIIIIFLTCNRLTAGIIRAIHLTARLVFILESIASSGESNEGSSCVCVCVLIGIIMVNPYAPDPCVDIFTTIN